MTLVKLTNPKKTNHSDHRETKIVIRPLFNEKILENCLPLQYLMLVTGYS